MRSAPGRRRRRAADLRRIGRRAVRPAESPDRQPRRRDLDARLRGGRLAIRRRRVPAQTVRPARARLDDQGPGRRERPRPAGGHRMIERLSSGPGESRRDLGGGLPSPAINLIAGAPGSGKTMLAQQYAFTNGTIERPAVYLATTSEPLDKLVRYGQELSFFDASQGRQRRPLRQPPTSRSRAAGLQGVIERVIELLRDIRPGILVFDWSRRSGRSAPTSTPTASSSRSWPDASRPPRRARSGSGSTPRASCPTRSRPPSPTRSSSSRRFTTDSGCSASCASTRSAAARSSRATTRTASARTG